MEPKAKRRALENGDVSCHYVGNGRTADTCPPSNEHAVYLDYNATTPLETSVLDAIYSTLKYAWGNPSSCYAEGKMAKRIINESRVHVSKMIKSTPSDVLFTSGGTESNNMVFHSVINRFKQRFPPTGNSSANSTCLDGEGCCSQTTALPHIITSSIEHDSVILALKSLKSREKIELTVLPVSKETGQIKVGDIMLALKWNTTLVSVMLANNETGVIQVNALPNGFTLKVKCLKEHEISKGTRICLGLDVCLPSEYYFCLKVNPHSIYNFKGFDDYYHLLM